MKLSRRLDLPALLTELAVVVTDTDDEEVHGLCPHQAREGDVPRRSHWSINKRTGQHHCFSCGYGGNLVTLACEQNGWFLKTRGPKGERLHDIGRAEEYIRTRTMDVSGVFDLPEWERPAVLEERTEMGEYRLEAFGRPPAGPLHDRHLSAEACEAHGVRWDVMNDAWILPVRDPDSEELWGWQVKGHRSRLFRNHPRGVKKARTLFGLDALHGRTAVLVESPLDAVRLTGIGWHGISSFGAAVSKPQLRLLEAHCDRLVVAMDNPADDDAGRRSAYELLKALGRRMDVRFLDYGPLDGAKDVGDCEDDAAIEAALKGARHAWRGRKAIIGA